MEKKSEKYFIIENDIVGLFEVKKNEEIFCISELAKKISKQDFVFKGIQFFGIGLAMISKPAKTMAKEILKNRDVGYKVFDYTNTQAAKRLGKKVIQNKKVTKTVEKVFQETLLANSFQNYLQTNAIIKIALENQKNNQKKIIQTVIIPQYQFSAETLLKNTQADIFQRKAAKEAKIILFNQESEMKKTLQILMAKQQNPYVFGTKVAFAFILINTLIQTLTSEKSTERMKKKFMQIRGGLKIPSLDPTSHVTRWLWKKVEEIIHKTTDNPDQPSEKTKISWKNPVLLGLIGLILLIGVFNPKRPGEIYDSFPVEIPYFPKKKRSFFHIVKNGIFWAFDLQSIRPYLMITIAGITFLFWLNPNIMKASRDTVVELTQIFQKTFDNLFKSFEKLSKENFQTFKSYLDQTNEVLGKYILRDQKNLEVSSQIINELNEKVGDLKTNLADMSTTNTLNTYSLGNCKQQLELKVVQSIGYENSHRAMMHELDRHIASPAGSENSQIIAARESFQQSAFLKPSDENMMTIKKAIEDQLPIHFPKEEVRKLPKKSESSYNLKLKK